MTDIHSLACEMSTGEEPVNLHILQLLFYKDLTVTCYTIIGLFLDSVRPLRSSRQNYCNECQACIIVLSLYTLLSNLNILLVTSLDLRNNFQEKLAGRKLLFSVALRRQQRYSSSLHFGNA